MPVYGTGSGIAKVKHKISGEVIEVDMDAMTWDSKSMWMDHPQLGRLTWTFMAPDDWSTEHKIDLGGHQLVTDFEFAYDEGPGFDQSPRDAGHGSALQ